MKAILLALLAAPLAGCNLFIDLDGDGDDVELPIDAPVAVDAADDGLFFACDRPMPCPAPSAGLTTVCGRLWDTELEQPVRELAADGSRCDAPTADGPCALSVRYFDALDFAQNPPAAVELAAAETYLDTCGRFHAIDMVQPTFGFIGVVVDDSPGTADSHVTTAVTLAAGAARPAVDLQAYATRASSDGAWSVGAGLSGQTFAVRGALLTVFLHGTTPVAGVRVTRDGNQVPADDFYFSDPGVTRSTIDPARATTGPSGAVLSINAPTPIAHSGTGGEPAGCTWPSSLGMGIPGVILVQRKLAEAPGGAPCP